MKTVLAILLLAASGAVLGALPDPTRPTLPGAAASAGPGYRLESILVSPVRRQAVIDGHLVQVGDRVGHAVVLRIDPETVWLRGKGRPFGLRLIAAGRLQTVHNDKNSGGGS